MSLTEDVECLNAIMDRAIRQGQELVASSPGVVLVAEAEQLADFTPQDLQAALERVGVEVDSRTRIRNLERRGLSVAQLVASLCGCKSGSISVPRQCRCSVPPSCRTWAACC